jgi:hypothetical protein
LLFEVPASYSAAPERVFTAHLTGANGGTGLALVEIYELP